MSEVNRKLEEIERELLKQKKKTNRLYKLNKAFHKEKHEPVDLYNVVETLQEKFHQLEV